VYDYMFASGVQSGQHKGYLPSVDNTLATNKGVCFDFSALLACMMRAQGIPARLEIGYADKVYHAWNSVYINGSWRRIDVTMEICHGQVGKYTLERFY